MNSSDFRQLAWGKLSGNWGGPISVVLVQALILGVLSSLSRAIPFISIASLIVAGPLMVGVAGYFVHFAKSKNPLFDELFDGFKNAFANSILLFILTGLFTFLWSLLFIIPGIIKAYAYMMAPYIMAENPDISPTQALDESQEMMKGYKMDLLILQLSFIGWILLVLVTFGIAAIWVGPYMEAARAEFYLQVSGGNKAPEVVEEQPQAEDSFDSFLLK